MMHCIINGHKSETQVSDIFTITVYQLFHHRMCDTLAKQYSTSETGSLTPGMAPCRFKNVLKVMRLGDVQAVEPNAVGQLFAVPQIEFERRIQHWQEQ
jgi:hypothetical protein